MSNPFGVPVLHPLARTTNPVTYYVAPDGFAGASDDNPGTQARPLATLERALEYLPDTINHPTSIRCRRGTYTMPPSQLLRGRTVNSWLEFKADDAWDPNVFTSVAAGTATAGTSGVTVAVLGGGLTVDVWRGKTIEFLDGAAVGQRRHVRDNTATNVIPSYRFNPAPADGDTFRIFDTDGVVFRPPTGAAAGSPYPIALSQVSSMRTEAFGTVGDPINTEGQGAVVLQGILFNGATDSGYNTLVTSDGSLFLYGCQFGADLATIPWWINSTGLLGLGVGMSLGTTSGLAAYRPLFGWGLNCGTRRSPRVGTGAYCGGYIEMGDAIDIECAHNGNWQIFGGRLGRFIAFEGYAEVGLFEAGTSTQCLVTAGGSAFWTQTVALPDITRPSILGAIEVRSVGDAIQCQGAHQLVIFPGVGFGLELTDGTPPATLVSATLGGRIFVNGATGPYHNAGTDWNCEGAFDPTAVLTGANTSQIGATSRSKILRVT